MVSGQLVPDQRVTEILAYTGFVDAAAKLFEERGDKALLRLRPGRPSQGGRSPRSP
ncbi:hypothetical protein ACFCZT_32095 [Streptomyces sp. NPDC056230]|uniref:hypothetical protein n=1 Tax=Streptomyces sp. NPDC056230 TaxID=3345754 RepID=UPI0035E2938F